MIDWYWIPVTVVVMLIMGLIVLECLGRKIMAEDKEILEYLRAVSDTLARTDNHLDKAKSVMVDMQGSEEPQ